MGLASGKGVEQVKEDVKRDFLLALGRRGRGLVVGPDCQLQVHSVKLLDWGEEENRTEAEISSLREAFTQEVSVWYKLDNPNVMKVSKLQRACPKNLIKAKKLGDLNKFKAGECNILVCTSVESRGLDIPSVDVVINYDIPSNSKDYIHCVDRTARVGRSRLAISLVSQYEVEWYLQIGQLIGRDSWQLIGKKLEKFPCEEEEILVLLKHVSEAKGSFSCDESDGQKKRRKGGDDDYKVERYVVTHKNGRSSKKSK